MTPDYKWHTSCSPGWIQNGNTFKFYLKKGTVGKCPGDEIPLEGAYEFKERQEVRSDRLESGIYIWSADIRTISRAIEHATYFSLFQIHDGRVSGRPPHSIQVREGNIFLLQEDEDTEFYVSKYKGRLSIATKIYVKGKIVTVEYIIDGVKIAKLKSKGLDQPFIKFGAYRWNAVCDVKQVYENVRFEKLK